MDGKEHFGVANFASACASACLGMDALKDLLAEPCDVEFVIRETRRKFQHSVAELTAWELKG